MKNPKVKNELRPIHPGETLQEKAASCEEQLVDNRKRAL